jgi:hypothetical protein
MDAMRFLFNGNVLRDTQTPEELGMKHDDVIECCLIDPDSISILGIVGPHPDLV